MRRYFWPHRAEHAAGNQPPGLVNVAGVAQNNALNPSELHGSFCALEAQIENSDRLMDSYSVIVSPGDGKFCPRPRVSPVDQSRPGQRSAALKARRKLPTPEPLPDADRT
jgi:hypothetical protein